ncbi:MAG TPA: helix-turn-helix domain-containing protein [Demequina sp.]|nr:helix-turn-helix domain-containing protein [Demequina sp.]
MSRTALGDALGVSRQTINSIETGKYDPPPRLRHLSFLRSHY